MSICASVEFTYNTKSINSGTWVLQALRMKHAADIVFSQYSAAGDRCINGKSTSLAEAEDLELIMPASLLYGFALENILKARIIKHTHPKAGELKALFGGKNGHNLVGLAKKAGLELSVKERDIANRLSSFTVWAGRYPIPWHKEDMVIPQLAIAATEKKENPKTGDIVEMRHPCFPMPLYRHERGLFDNLFERARPKR